MSTDDNIACPKCSKKHEATVEACPRCGLVFALWNEASAPKGATLDERGQALWQGLEGTWSDGSRHEEFLRHCLQTDTLAAAGRLYRQRLDDNPKDTMAAQMQAQLLSKATLNLSLQKTQPRQPVTRSRWFWTIALLAMALGTAGGLLWRRFR